MDKRTPWCKPLIKASDKHGAFVSRPLFLKILVASCTYLRFSLEGLCPRFLLSYIFSTEMITITADTKFILFSCLAVQFSSKYF